MNDKDTAFDSTVVEYGLKITNMVTKTIRILPGFIGKTAADMIWSNTAVAVTQSSDQIAIQIGPGRIAVNHDHSRPGTFINIGEPVAAY